jgi:hypothetical protein
MQALEETFNPLLLGLFLLVMSGICLTAFSVSMVSFPLIKISR